MMVWGTGLVVARRVGLDMAGELLLERTLRMCENVAARVRCHSIE